MLHLTYLSGSRQGTADRFEKDVVRLGRGEECDVRFDPEQDARVSKYHAQLVWQDNAWFVVDTGSTNGTWVNQERVLKRRLTSGDRIVLGHPGGPEIEIQFDSDVPAPRVSAGEAGRTEFAMANPDVARLYDAGQDAADLAAGLKGGVRDSSADALADLAAQKVAEERARAGGRSGKTVDIMAVAFHKVSDVVKTKTRRKWVRVVALVAGVAVVGLSVMGFIIWRQQQEIDRLLARKGAIDQEIAAVQEEMQVEQDSTRLEELEGMLTTLTGSAERTLEKLSEADEAKAVAAAQGSDELDREIRRILASFNASTYAIPPIFRERLQYHIDEMMKARPTVRAIYARKQKYWPMIIREFDALGLPEEMAYVAWQESKFDPVAESSAGAVGLWQMTAGTARSYGLEVDDSVDERTDPDKQTRAAARYLANLLAEFGEDSFMLAMAAYNRGESGVRRVLHQIAAEPGGFKKNKRDFWHLYRMKKLPEETREYVPKILAAAIVASNPEKYGIGK